MSATATLPASGVGAPAPAATERSTHGRLAVVVVFGVVVGVTMWRHEMWRDELQAWMIARGAPSISDLSWITRYEGHPFLWYAALWPLARFATTPWPMQALQWFLAVATMGLVAWRAPFTRAQLWLFALGYFTVFEYGVLSRSYTLGFFYIVLICAVASTRARWPWCGPLIALLALTSAFGVILAGALALGLLVDEVLRRRAGEDGNWLPVTVGGLVAAAGLFAAYRQTAPPGDAGIYMSWKTDIDADLANTSLAALWRALVPIPQLTREFWNTNLIDGVTVVGTLVGIAATLAIGWLLRRRPAAVVVWLVGAFSVVAFLYAKIRYAGASRHFGHIFLALFAALWLAPAFHHEGDPAGEARAASTRSRAWTGILALQVVAGLLAVSLDLATPFSNGKQAAGWLRSEGLDLEYIVGIPDTSASVIAAYLDRDIYYPAGGRLGSYVLWDEERIGPLEPLREGIRRLAADRPVLLVTNAPDPAGAGFRLELLASFDDGIVSDEHYWIFRILPPG